MAPSEPEGLALALELTELGSELVAQRFRREHPAAPEHDGDAVGRRVERPGLT